MALGTDLAEADHDDVPNWTARALLGASHWVHPTRPSRHTAAHRHFRAAQPGKDDQGTSASAGRPG